MGITHATAATGTDSGDGKISHNAWNEEHTGVTTVATDAIWDAAGDLAVGTGADTAAKLTKGSDGDVLTMVSGAVAWDAPAAGGAAEIVDIPTAETDPTLVLAPDGTGGVEFRAEAGGAVWTPDTPPVSPNAADDEFTALSGWTTLGALDTLNVTDYPGHVHMVKNTSGTQLDGIYKAAPSMPFTVTTKVSDALDSANYHWYGLMIGDSTPTAWYSLGALYASGNSGLTPEWSSWSDRTSRTNKGVGAVVFTGLRYFRMVVTDQDTVGLYWSRNGLVWKLAATIDPGFSPAKVGLFISGFSAIPMDATFDWIRFT